jgi:hypothetical protein
MQVRASDGVKVALDEICVQESGVLRDISRADPNATVPLPFTSQAVLAWAHGNTEDYMLICEVIQVGSEMQSCRMVPLAMSAQLRRA